MADDDRQLLEYLQLDDSPEGVLPISSLPSHDLHVENQLADSLSASATDGDDEVALLASSPLFSLEEASLQTNREKNKESLKRKLMFRRTVHELVDQGIYPSHTPAAFAEQSKHLQRAQTGDILRQKIQCRPDRSLLIQHNILNECSADSSLVGKIGQLKRARLTDTLNEKLAHRPGPLELVCEDILVVDPAIKDAIKDGTIEYHRTQEGLEVPSIQKLPYEVESPKSGASSPEPSPSEESDSPCTNLTSATVPSPPNLSLTQPSSATVPSDASVYSHVGLAGGSLPPAFFQSMASTAVANAAAAAATAAGLPVCQGSMIMAAPGLMHSLAQAGLLTSSTCTTGAPRTVGLVSSSNTSSVVVTGMSSIPRTNGRISKKSKPKPQNKQKQIKFHEYKGPPSATSQHQSTVSSTSPPPRSPLVLSSRSGLSCATKVDTAPPVSLCRSTDGLIETQYSLLLQQQQLFLQCQVEFPQKSLPVLVPVQALQQQQSQPQHSDANVPQAPASPPSLTTSAVTGTMLGSLQSTAGQHPKVILSKSFSNLQDMKVADLKAELKQRNLPVSGSKSQLIERLKNCQDDSSNGLLRCTSQPVTFVNVNGMKAAMPEIDLSNSRGTQQIVPPSYSTTSLELVQSPLHRSNSSDTALTNSMPMEMDDSSSTTSSRAPSVTPTTHEDIVRKQQRQIEELQRELIRSQLELQKHQQLQIATQVASLQAFSSAPSHSPSATLPRTAISALSGLQPAKLSTVTTSAAGQSLPAETVTVARPAGGSSIVVMSSPASPYTTPDKRSLLITPVGGHAAVSTINRPTAASTSSSSCTSASRATASVTTCTDGRNGTFPSSRNVVKDAFAISSPVTPSDFTEAVQTNLPAGPAVPGVALAQPVNTSAIPSHSLLQRESHSVDDVLEILIRTGELPASAVLQPPSSSAAVMLSCPNASSQPSVAVHAPSSTGLRNESSSVQGLLVKPEEPTVSSGDLFHHSSETLSPINMDWADMDTSVCSTSVKTEPGLSVPHDSENACGSIVDDDPAFCAPKQNGHAILKRETDSPGWVHDGGSGEPPSLGTLDFQDASEFCFDDWVWDSLPQGINTMSMSCAAPAHASNAPFAFHGDPLLTTHMPHELDVLSMDDSDFGVL